MFNISEEEFKPTMEEFCQMILDQQGKIVGVNINGSYEDVVDEIKRFGYYKPESLMIDSWARKGSVFQIDDKYLIVLNEDNSINAILSVYEIENWVQQDGVVAVSGNKSILIYNIEKMKFAYTSC